MRNVIIIGGGLAGLISAIQLARAGISCTLIEKKSYPLHRVCGEYVSNEVLSFLTASGLYPNELDLPQIKVFEYSSVSGKSLKLPLDLGGFGISRYTFDNHLFQIAKREGVSFVLGTEVTEVAFANDRFEIYSPFQAFSADVVIGSFGKRSKIDAQQNRDFMKKRSPYAGVKYHVRTDHPKDVVSLHNFPQGYCGVVNVEGGLTNICYLTHRDNLKRYGNISEMERRVLFTNPMIRNVFNKSEFLFTRPEVINEISFETKEPVENHILMAGDAAGMITPLCGNGMAMAIHSAEILSGLLKEYCSNKITRAVLETRYRKAWTQLFRNRLWIGRRVQGLFGHGAVSTFALHFARFCKPAARFIVSKTHGKAF